MKGQYYYNEKLKNMKIFAFYYLKKLKQFFPSIFFIWLSINLMSCEGFLEPEKDNRITEKELIKDPSFVEGILLNAYYELPRDYDFITDIASDDAVTNVKGGPGNTVATGGWNSNFNPFSQWEKSYRSIFYINKFLELYENVNWSNSPMLNKEDNKKTHELHLKRLKGEAYGLRAWFQFLLLQYHSGLVENGEMLGFPIITTADGLANDVKLKRNTFQECVSQILSDCDTAIKYLPFKYKNSPENDPVQMATMGSRFENRINGGAAYVLKSRCTLLASSPLFKDYSEISAEMAANYSAEFIKLYGILANYRTRFFESISNDEIIWNSSIENKANWENANFPPSLYGQGNTNPSQSLVESFPMLNGYPISHKSSGYISMLPYRKRDPRLDAYIIYNQSRFKETIISTNIGAAQDGKDILLSSTRTGYYIKKLMDSKVNLTPFNYSATYHTYTYARMTEVYLNFAEAANEVFGPDSDPNGFGFTVRDVLSELRRTAGISQPDKYLESLTTKEEIAELIKNERRIELCFEGFRFWDIRRWKDENLMNNSVYGIDIIGSTSFTKVFVEERKFKDYMFFGPLPYAETLKYDLKQNNGW